MADWTESPMQRHRAVVMKRSAEANDGYARCVLHGPDCRGRLQAHHSVPKQRIKSAHSRALYLLANGRGEELSPGQRDLAGTTIENLIADASNGVAVCEVHHSRGDIPIPDSAREFAARYGFTL